MKTAFTVIFSALLLHAGVFAQDDWANFGRYAEANLTAPRGANAVFMGNSITQGWANTHPQFFSENGYIGRGIGGQVTSQMLARFRADVIDLEPRCVVILAGTNDIAGNMGAIDLQNICGNIISMAELAKYHGIRVLVCSVLPAYEYGWRPGVEPAGKIMELNDMLREYAINNDCTWVDFHTEMKDDRNGLPPAYTTDEVHVTSTGFKVMEDIIKPLIDRNLR